MLRLRVLGTLQLTAPNRKDVESVPLQAKRAALLAYLAVTMPRGAVRRDKLHALFWPELDQARARAALNQAVYALRATLGEDALAAHGDGALGLRSDVVWCDVTSFDAALDEGRPAEALALYRGDLLDGFFISGAPEFEHWLDRERERLRRRAAEGAWAVAESKAAEGDVFESARWARHAADLIPADENQARRLMSFLHKLGDRAAAIQVYESLRSRLSQEYELEPSAETQTLAETIRRAQVSTPATRAVRAAESRSAAIPGMLELVPRRRWKLAFAASVAAVAIVAFAWSRWSRWESEPRRVITFTLDFPANQQLPTGVAGPMIVVSPDGSQFVYLSWGLEGTQLVLRPIDQNQSAPVPHTREARVPFFSPDGEWLGFVARDTMRKVRIRGGPAFTVTPVPTRVAGASWGRNDTIVFARAGALWMVPASGGEARVIAAPDTARGERYRWPEVLPDGRFVLFTKVAPTGLQLAAASLETGAVFPVGVEGTDPHFITPGRKGPQEGSARGYLLFARPDGVILAAPFDPVALRVTGPPETVAEGVQVGTGGVARLGVSREGTLAFLPNPTADRMLVLVDRSGQERRLPVPRRGFNDAQFSPNGKRIATAVMPPQGELPDIWVLDLQAETFRQVTFDQGNRSPVWSRDGERILFARDPPGALAGFAIRSVAADGSRVDTLYAPTEPYAPDRSQYPTSSTPDGVLAFLKRDPGSGFDIVTLDPTEKTMQPYLTGRADEHSPVFSPDGRWLAYVSNETGQNEVYVRSFPRMGGAVQVSARGGRQPRWSPGGGEVFYRGEEGMIAATVSTSPSFRVTRRKVLFDDEPYLAHLYGSSTYDVHPDSEHFLMIRLGSEARRVAVVLNWFTQLKRNGTSPALTLQPNGLAQ